MPQPSARNPQPLQIGSLGCGKIVEMGLISGAKVSKSVELAALASERRGVAAEWAARHKVPRSYESYEALLADPRIDAVYVPSSGETHAQWTIAAAKAGKHVLCEKPLARTGDEAEQMAAACRDAGVVLQEAFMWRHHPRMTRARELFDAGAIGKLRLIAASFSFFLDRPDDWRFRPERGGGALWDLGSYGINAARWFANAEPTDVLARSHWGPTGVDLTTQVTLKFPNDVIAGIDCSFETPFRCRLELSGDAGRMVLNGAFHHEGDTVIELYRSTAGNATPERITIQGANDHAFQLDKFAASIAAGKVLMPAEDGVENTRVVERAYAAAR